MTEIPPAIRSTRLQAAVLAVRWLLVLPAALLGSSATCSLAGLFGFFLAGDSLPYYLQVAGPALGTILAAMLALPAAIWLAAWTAPSKRLLVAQAVYWFGVVAAAAALQLSRTTMWFVLVPAITGRLAINAVSIRVEAD